VRALPSVRVSRISLLAPSVPSQNRPRQGLLAFSSSRLNLMRDLQFLSRPGGERCLQFLSSQFDARPSVPLTFRLRDWNHSSSSHRQLPALQFLSHRTNSSKLFKFFSQYLRDSCNSSRNRGRVTSVPLMCDGYDLQFLSMTCPWCLQFLSKSSNPVLQFLSYFGKQRLPSSSSPCIANGSFSSSRHNRATPSVPLQPGDQGPSSSSLKDKMRERWR